MEARLTSEAFNVLIATTKPFLSASCNRPTYQTIRLEFTAETKSVIAYATDGFRLSQEKADCMEVDEDFEVQIYPPRLKASNKDEVRIWRDGNTAFVGYPGVTFETRQSDEKYLDCKKVISDAKKDSPVMKIGFNAKYLLDALTASKASVGKVTQPVILELRSPTSPAFFRIGEKGERMLLPVRVKEE